MVRDVTSPFSPGRPVSVESFVGRIAEIERLRRKVRDSVAARRVEVAFVTGERGIGKSSLASFVRFLGEREHPVLGVHALLGGVDTVEGAVGRVFDQLLKEHAEASYFGRIKELFGKHMRKVGLFGATVEFAASEQELRSLANGFPDALRGILSKVEKSGFILILDDINGLAESTGFADWFKSLVDGISLSKTPVPVAIILVGLEERRRSMIAKQPSVARIFDVVEIRAWSEEETRGFFESRFDQVGMKVDDTAWSPLLRFTGGLPVLAHEIGDAAFNIDRDGPVDERDASVAIVNAAEVVGRRYLDPVVFQSIRSRKYREILRTLTHSSVRADFTRAELKSQLGSDEGRVLDNFLRKMKELGVVVEDPERGRGAYRFSNQLHNLYFFLEAQRTQGMDRDRLDKDDAE